MSDVIERLLEVEQEARRLIAQGEREAEEAVEHAREEARRIVSEGHEEARRRAQEILDRTSEALQKQTAERVEEEKARLPLADGVDPGRLAEAVQFVVSLVAPGAEPRR